MEQQENKNVAAPNTTLTSEDILGRLWDKSWIYIKTVVDVVHEPILILDKKLCVIAANEPFYRTFQVEQKDTEGKLVYNLGNGQWNIQALKELLEEILPKNTFFKGFEVAHTFPIIGRKVMMLNARQIHLEEVLETELFPQIILLAIEDVTEMMTVADSVIEKIHNFEDDYDERTKRLELQVAILERTIRKIKGK